MADYLMNLVDVDAQLAYSYSSSSNAASSGTSSRCSTDDTNSTADSIDSAVPDPSTSANALSSPPPSAHRPELLRPRASQHPSWSGLILRRPGQEDAATFQAPDVRWLNGTWHITHSTLPIWKDKRNVRITYDIQKPDRPGGKERLDDVVEYQDMSSDKVKSVRGRNIQVKDHDSTAWDWRGKGIIKLASSHWDILGWGVDPLVTGLGVSPNEHKWMVTYFVKTVFTPAAIDFYSQDPAGLSIELVEQIKDGLTRSQEPDVARLANEVYKCQRDNIEHLDPRRRLDSMA